VELIFDKEVNLHELFVTQIGTFILPNAAELNPILTKAIRDRENTSRSWRRSNVGGWRSGMDLLDWPEVQATDFKESISSAILHMVKTVGRVPHMNAELSIVAWCNLNREGAFNTPHNHPKHIWSGVYYSHVDDMAPDGTPSQGTISLQDPRGAINMLRHPGKCNWGSSVQLKPVAGMVILFPSWLFHLVYPFKGEGERISIAFNANVESYEELHPL
jgi:uncharacterized protein (TIGR02466 family)